MMSAVVWCLVTGALWTGVGIYFSIINRQGRDPVLFNLCSAVFLLVICAGTVKWSCLLTAHLDSAALFKLTLVMIPTGMAITGGMVIMIVAMRKGPPDIVWTICQSSMGVPFALGLLLHGEQFTLLNLAGMLLIIVGICLFGGKRNTSESVGMGNGWFLLTLAAFSIIGAGQYLFSLPSYWSGWTDEYSLRIPIQAAGGLLLLTAIAKPSRLVRLDGLTWLHGGLFAVLTYISRTALYQAIDALAILKMVAIAYPVCIGLCIVGFVLYHAVSQRRFSLVTAGVTVLLVAGLFIIGTK